MSAVFAVRVQISVLVGVLWFGLGAWPAFAESMSDAKPLLDVKSAPDTREPTTIIVSIKPLQLIVGLLKEPLKILHQPVEVSTLLPRGATPHDYALKPSDIVKVLQADIVIWMGPLVEPYLTSIVARVDKRKVIDISQLDGLHRLSSRPLLSGHHHESAADELTFDPHVWWSVKNAEVIVDTVFQQVMRNSGASLTDTNLAKESQSAENKSRESLGEQLALLEKALQKYKALAAESSPSFILMHDGLHYLEQELGIESVARVALDDDHQPGIKTLLALKKRVIQQKVVCVVAEPNTSLAIVGKIEGDVPMRKVIIDILGWNATTYGGMLQHAYQQILSCRK